MAIVDGESIALIERGIAGLLRHLGMRPDGPPAVVNPVFHEPSEVVRSGVTGIFYPAVTKGQTVAKGARLGRVTDFHGTVLEEVTAPFGGEILYVLGTPPVSKGEPLLMVGGTKQ
jgi:predicted deacylase